MSRKSYLKLAAFSFAALTLTVISSSFAAETTGGYADASYEYSANSPASAPCPTSCEARAAEWSGKIGVVGLKREKLPSQILAQDITTGDALINANQFSFDFEAGPDVSIVRKGKCFDLEFRWFQVNDFISKTSEITAPNGLAFPFRALLGDPGWNTTGHASYLSQLKNFELNLKQPLFDSDALTGFVGIRFVEMNETLGLFTGVGDPDNHNDFYVNSFNDMYGAQVGLEAKLWDCGGPFTLGMGIKTGVFGNDVRNRGVYYVNQQIADGDSARMTHAAFLGEVGINAAYQLNDHWSVTVGYQVMWIDGVALATSQMSRLDPVHDPLDPYAPSVNADGTAFYHGMNLGLECRW